VTALSDTNRERLRSAIRWASAVLPAPGGPYRISDRMRSDSMARRSSFPGPRMCSWPTNSERFRGRILHARGDRPSSRNRDGVCSFLSWCLRLTWRLQEGIFGCVIEAKEAARVRSGRKDNRTRGWSYTGGCNRAFGADYQYVHDPSGSRSGSPCSDICGTRFPVHDRGTRPAIEQSSHGTPAPLLSRYHECRCSWMLSQAPELCLTSRSFHYNQRRFLLDKLFVAKKPR